MMVKYGTKEYRNADKRTSGKARKPFLIERFCAEFAWPHFQECPVYPFGDGKSDFFDGAEACHYLTKDEYPDYKCPMVLSVEKYAPLIAKKGTEEQKKALEYLADMFFKYATKAKTIVIPNRDSFSRAHEIYTSLGLTEKVEMVEREVEKRDGEWYLPHLNI